MSTIGKICGILSGILAACMVFVLGVSALEECLVTAGSSMTVMPKGEWFIELSRIVTDYGLYILIILCLTQIFVGRSDKTSGFAFLIYVVIVAAFIAVIFFKEDVVKLIK